MVVTNCWVSYHMRPVNYLRKGTTLMFENIYLIFIVYFCIKKTKNYNNLNFFLYIVIKKYLKNSSNYLYLSTKGFHLGVEILYNQIKNKSNYIFWLFPICVNIEFVILLEKVIFCFYNIIINIFNILEKQNIFFFNKKIRKFRILNQYYFFFMCELPVVPLIVYLKQYGCKIGWKESKKNFYQFDEDITHYIVNTKKNEKVLDSRYILVSELLDLFSSY
uniref:Uncharacterized protein n=1 Tax=Lotharella vacuolata TaxID=74820 RepID=A0A0H5BGV6_9EUKA|nr:hypothetical protein [Lotharella vacuolata]